MSEKKRVELTFTNDIGKEKTKKAKNGIDARNICDIISFVYWRLSPKSNNPNQS